METKRTFIPEKPEHKRINAWTFTRDNKYIESKIGEYKTASCRLMTKVSLRGFRQFFQIHYTDINDNTGYKSFEVFNDEEEREIKLNIPNIAEHSSCSVN